MDFSKELPCEYIPCSYEWADSLEVKMVDQMKRGGGGYIHSDPIDWNDLHVCILQTMPCDILD